MTVTQHDAIHQLPRTFQQEWLALPAPHAPCIVRDAQPHHRNRVQFAVNKGLICLSPLNAFCRCWTRLRMLRMLQSAKPKPQRDFTFVSSLSSGLRQLTQFLRFMVVQACFWPFSYQGLHLLRRRDQCCLSHQQCRKPGQKGRFHHPPHALISFSLVPRPMSQ